MQNSNECIKERKGYKNERYTKEKIDGKMKETKKGNTKIEKQKDKIKFETSKKERKKRIKKQKERRNNK